MLAGFEKALHAGKSFEVNGERTAIETLLTGLIDYAGLYPPASLDMHTAVRNYLQCQEGPQRAALGRFVVHRERLGELRTVAGDSFRGMRLSVIVPGDADLGILSELLGDEPGRVALECKVSQPSEIESISSQLPVHAECYFEIPVGEGSEEFLGAIAARCARVKMRMGGVAAEAFPRAQSVAYMLYSLAKRRLAFKATAGLHHPIRSCHPFTYEPDSPIGMMHGFVNMALAATLLHLGGTGGEALMILEEADPRAWRLAPDAITCRAFRWTADQLADTRRRFFISFGSCSFEEPIRDLEAMGWL